MKQKSKDQIPNKETSTTSDQTLKEAALKATQALDCLNKVDQFKSAGELGLSQKSLDALIKTLEMLENGEIKHSSNPLMVLNEGISFNMLTWRTHHNCGTVCCIGGTAQELGADFGLRRGTPPELNKLFYMNETGSTQTGLPSDRQMSITPEQAGKALRSYLETGKADLTHFGM